MFSCSSRFGFIHRLQQKDEPNVASALAEGLEFIVTSNLRDFRKSPVKAVSPVEFLKQIR
jgi:hypothetical protein